MGNQVCYSSSGSPLAPCGWLDWCRGSFIEPVPVCIWRCMRFLFWLLFQVVRFIAVALRVIWTFISSLYPTFLIFFLVGLATFAWWYYFPTLAPYVRDVAVPLINLGLQLFCFEAVASERKTPDLRCYFLL